MDLSEKPQAPKAQVRVILTEEELQLSAIDDLCNKYYDWVRVSKESAGGRKTRAANKRADTIYEEIMAFKLPPIRMKSVSMSPPRNIRAFVQENGVNNNSNTNNHHYSNGNAHNSNSQMTKSSIEGESEGSVGSSGTTGRILRPRCRTPSVSRKQPEASPSTPTHQSIRAHMKKNPDSNSSSVLSAALNQQHPSVSVTKIRQLLRADSAQKKREEEKERQERVRLERKAKEERAEAQKKQMLEERAETAKRKREQRLKHAAEVRKEREKTKIEQKLKEALPVTAGKSHVMDQADETQIEQQAYNNNKKLHQPSPPTTEPSTKQLESIKNTNEQQPPQTKQALVAPVSAKQLPKKQQEKVEQPERQQTEPPAKPRKLDETFQKPPGEDNIDISVHDETNDEQTKKANAVAAWAKAPHLRDAVIAQFKKEELELLKEAFEIFGRVKLPVDLNEIFASHKPINNRYLARTSSAVWTPPNKPLKRSSSSVFTPEQPKR